VILMDQEDHSLLVDQQDPLVLEVLQIHSLLALLGVLMIPGYQEIPLFRGFQ